jgi:Carboxypeptidase regulatory-like domain
MSKKFQRPLLLLLFANIWFFGTECSAQTTNASVSGIISDPSGSVVYDASVLLTNVETGVEYNARSNSDGLYRATGLVPGQYRIYVSKQGFKSVVNNDIELHVQDTLAVNFSLQVGAVSESVTVQAAEPLLQTESSSLSQVIQGRTVQDMPLNGRNVLNLISLVPGVVAQGGASGSVTGNQLGGAFTSPSGWGNYQIGGGLSNQSAMFVDGAPINVTYGNTTSLVPTQDAVREFRVQTNNVTPEYGRFAGGVVNLSTKSGTNNFHGSTYEYIRNTVLDANYFFNNRSAVPRPALTQNQYGATFSGPIEKEKAFFFFGWEGFALRTATPLISTVPTAQMRQGDFSQVGLNIYDPATTQSSPPFSRLQFMGCNGNQPNVICSTRIDPTAAVLQNFFPRPNLPGLFNNYIADASTGGNHNQYTFRSDWAMSDKQHLFGRYTYWTGDQLSTNPYHNTTGLPRAVFTTQQGVFGDTYAISNTTVVDLRLSYLRFVIDTLPLSTGVDLSKFGPNYASLANQVSLRQNPIPNIAGMTDFIWGSQDTTVLDTNDNYVLSANIVKILGRHSLSFGGEARKLEWYFGQDNIATGQYSFDNSFTAQNTGAGPIGGSAYASFLLGTVTQGLLQTVDRPAALEWYGAAFANDTFQVNRRLTLNLGLRWEQPGSYYEKHNRLNVWLPNAVDPLSQATGLNLHGQFALVNTPLYRSRTEQQLHWDRFSPRVGFAFRAASSTTIRGGYGITYLPNDSGFASGPEGSPVNIANSIMQTLPNGSGTTLSNPFPNGLVQPIGNDVSRLGELEGSGFVTATLPYGPYPYAQQWNLNVGQQIAAKTVLEIGYAGSKGTHLPLYVSSLDQLSPAYLSQGASLTNFVPNPFFGKVPANTLLGELPAIPAGQLLRPYPQFFGVFAASPFIGGSVYHSLQAKLQRQFGAGGNLLASYTWSKLISDTDSLTAWVEAATPGGQYGQQNAYDRGADRSVSANDVTHNFVLSYVVDLPLGNGKRFLGDIHGIPQALFGGWSVNGVTSLRSGFPLSFGALPTFLSTFFGAGSPRPNVVPGCTKNVSGSAQARLGGWFNTSCFTQPTPLGFGDEGRNDSQLRAAGINNWDMALFKTVPIREKLNAQFRAEVFNLANRVQFGPPGTTVGTPQFGVVSNQLNQPRVFQFSLRLNY